jgi:arylsulfatase A-like enzyme
MNLPTIDRLGRDGLIYNTSYGADLSPRAWRCSSGAILIAQTGTISGDGMAFRARHPSSRTARAAGCILQMNGYSTAMARQVHSTPESGPTGPFDQWPIGLGLSGSVAT